MLFVNSTELIVLLVVCAVAAACFVAAMVLLVWTVNNQKRKQKSGRELVELVADSNAVKSEFAFGEEFACNGLTVNAYYNRKPKSETLTQFDILTEEEYTLLTEAGAANGLYVIKPNMTEAGRAVVIIRYKNKATYYAITVAEPAQEPAEEVPQEEPVQEEIVREEVAPAEEVPQEVAEETEEPVEEPIIEEPDDETAEEESEKDAEKEPEEKTPIVIEEESYEGILRYDKSFMARYIQSGDEIKGWYTAIKNEILSYKKVKARTSWRRESFRMGREEVARFGFHGKTLCIYFPLNPADYAEGKYKIVDVSGRTAYANVPCMLRLKGKRRAQYAIELFSAVMERMGGVRTERIREDYYLPYEGIVELIEKGLARRIIKDKADEAIFLRGSSAETDAATETAEIAEEIAATEETAQTAAEEPAEEPIEEPMEEPVIEEPDEETVQTATEEPVIEELSEDELHDVEDYEEAASDEDGIEVVGVMFRRRGRKVYWFDPDGRTWEKGEIALYKSPDNPPQEVIVVDNAKISQDKLHLPLKPLCKVARRLHTDSK